MRVATLAEFFVELKMSGPSIHSTHKERERKEQQNPGVVVLFLDPELQLFGRKQFLRQICTRETQLEFKTMETKFYTAVFIPDAALIMTPLPL